MHVCSHGPRTSSTKDAIPLNPRPPVLLSWRHDSRERGGHHAEEKVREKKSFSNIFRLMVGRAPVEIASEGLQTETSASSPYPVRRATSLVAKLGIYSVRYKNRRDFDLKIEPGPEIFPLNARKLAG